MIAEGIPREFRKQAVVLMRVAAPLREDHIRLDEALQLLEKILYLSPTVGQKTVAILLQYDLFFASCGEHLCGLCGFLAAGASGTENDPVKLQSRENLLEMQQRTTTTNLNIIRMRAQTEQLNRVAAPLGQLQSDQATSPAACLPFFHKHHGGEPEASISSSNCLSRNVSMHCQKPSYRFDHTLFSAINLWNGS